MKPLCTLKPEWKHRNMSEELLLKFKSLTQGTLQRRKSRRTISNAKDKIIIGDPLADEIAFLFLQRNTCENSFCGVLISQMTLWNTMDIWVIFQVPFSSILDHISIPLWRKWKNRTSSFLLVFTKNYLSIVFFLYQLVFEYRNDNTKKPFFSQNKTRTILPIFWLHYPPDAPFDKRFWGIRKQNFRGGRENRTWWKNKIFNTRQIELYRILLSIKMILTFQRHQRYHHISYITARKDILELQKRTVDFWKTRKDILFSSCRKIFCNGNYTFSLTHFRQNLCFCLLVPRNLLPFFSSQKTPTQKIFSRDQVQILSKDDILE